MFYLIILLTVFAETHGAVPTLSVPQAGNCGDDTVLTCSYSGTLGSSWSWFISGIGSVFINGQAVASLNAGKYEETQGLGFFSLIIKNTQITDSHEYRCAIEFDVSQLKTLNFECKGKLATETVSQDKRLTVTVDNLYPSPANFAVLTLPSKGSDGTYICKASSMDPSLNYYKCVWTSNQSLPDGNYTYSVTVTTITSVSLDGTFKIVGSAQPDISSTDIITNNRKVVHGFEDQHITLQCTSRGGFPAPTLSWYRTSVSQDTLLNSTDTGSLEGDNTYTVTLSYQFVTCRQNDRENYICRSNYPQASAGLQDPKENTVLLYLKLKPNKPIVKQTNTVAEGGTISVQCTTTGSRPAASLSWLYRGKVFTGFHSSTEDQSTEIFTTDSVLHRPVTREDNGHTIQCVATHEALVNPISQMTESTNLVVSFPPVNVTIEGNVNIVADGSNVLQLSCDSGSSLPVSSISWDIGHIQSSEETVSNLTGEYGGTRTLSTRVLTPTRDDDGAVIKCSASNSVSAVSSQVTLDLRYEPRIFSEVTSIYAIEGESLSLPCVASSKPPSAFIWKMNSTVLDQGIGSDGNNKHDYLINNVRVEQARVYTCTADNHIGSPDSISITLIVKCSVCSTSAPTGLVVGTATGSFIFGVALSVAAMLISGRLQVKRNANKDKRTVDKNLEELSSQTNVAMQNVSEQLEEGANLYESLGDKNKQQHTYGELDITVEENKSTASTSGREYINLKV